MPYLTLRGEPLAPIPDGAAPSGDSSGDGPRSAAAGEPAPVRPGTIEVVLFDKDGTLSHSEPMLHALAMARVDVCLSLASAHLIEIERQSQLPLRNLLERAYGLLASGIHPAGTTAVASREHNLISTATALAQAGLGWPDALAIAEEVFRLTDEAHGQGSPHRPQPTEGLQDLLGELQAAGVRCAVISNDDADGIQAFLASHGLETHFAGLWSADHRPCKPHPGAVHGLCRELGVSPARCALIGDANSDLRMARAAGVAVVLGYRAGWLQPAPLDPGFRQLDHWRELGVIA